MRKSVILQVLPMLKRGGVEAFVMNNFRSIDRERFQFIFLIIGEGEEYDDEISSLGGKVIHSGLCFSHASKLIPNFIALIKLLKNIEFDAIHSHINQFNGLIFLAAIIAGKRGFVSHSHGTDYEDNTGGVLRRLVYRKLFYSLTRRLSDIRLACGELAGKTLYKSSSFSVLPNAVDVQRLNNISDSEIKSYKASLGIPDTARVYSSISRFDTNKNLVFAVDIFDSIHKRDQNTMLLVGGVGDETRADVEARIREYGLENNVRVFGKCDIMRDIYHISDCWIMPSMHEGLPFSLIEAQACGLHSVITTSIDTNADMGLGLVHFCSLSDRPEHWAETALSCHSHTLTMNEIMEKMDLKGYLLSTNIKHLETIYEKVLCIK